MTDNEMLLALSGLLDEKLKPVKEDVQTLKEDVQTLKGDVKTLKLQNENDVLPHLLLIS